MTEHTQQVTLTVGQVAERFGVTVRTLHHYDEVGLLSPSGRSGAGYRLYTEDDLARLQHVVVYRRLGFALEEIALLLDHPESVEAHLRRQRAAVLSRLDELRELVAAIDRALEREMSNQPATPDEMKELFGEGFHDARAEAEERWGETDAWKQSQQRARSYSKEDWLRIRDEGADVEARLAAALRGGVPADSEQAMDLAEAHRQHIGRWFYECSPEMHAGLGRMYVEDERFTAHYEQRAPGLAQYVSTAVQANAARHGS
jgi:DNA-binding transcriptional MerR regulator